MSPLQIGLLVIAVVAVAAVYLYNLFEERRVQRRMDGVFREPEDVLLAPRATSAVRREPSLAAAAEESEEVVSLSAEATGNRVIEAPEIAPPVVEPIEAIELPSLPDEAPVTPSAGAPVATGENADPDAVIESLACFSFGEGMAAGVFLAACPAQWRTTLCWYGRPEGSEAWQRLKADNPPPCGEITAGLLLANRQGAVSRALLRDYFEAMNELARSSGATLMLPELSTELARADALDQACSVVDVQVGLTLLRRDANVLPGTRLRGVAEAAGFRLNDRGGFDYRHEDSGRLMFELVDVGGRPLDADSLKSLQLAGITLLLDVPRIGEPLRAFDQMKAVARRLGITLEAALVDDARRPLADSALAAIRSQLQQACAAMRDMQVEPGSARALRLFS